MAWLYGQECTGAEYRTLYVTKGGISCYENGSHVTPKISACEVLDEGMKAYTWDAQVLVDVDSTRMGFAINGTNFGPVPYTERTQGDFDGPVFPCVHLCWNSVAEVTVSEYRSEATPPPGAFGPTPDPGPFDAHRLAL